MVNGFETRRGAVWRCLALQLTTGLAAAQIAASPRLEGEAGRLTLRGAIASALENSPPIEGALAEVQAARARLLTAGTYPYNPELEVAAADRSAPGGSSTDRELALSQEIEIAGQRGRRRSVAREALAAAEDRLERRRWETVAAVTTAYAETASAAELRRVAEVDAALTREMVALEERRLGAGAGTQIAVNVARSAAGRSLRRLREDEAAWAGARSRLVEAMGGRSIGGSEVRGELGLPHPTDLDLDLLVAWALEHRADLKAVRRDLEQTRRVSALQRSLAVPNLRVRLYSGREEEADIAGASFGISIPLFERNRGGIAEADAASAGSMASLREAELAVRQEVEAALAHYRSALAAARSMRELVVGTLEESTGLLRRALEAGKIGVTDVLVLRRELFEARREAVAALRVAWISRARLELACGATLTEIAREIAL